MTRRTAVVAHVLLFFRLGGSMVPRVVSVRMETEWEAGGARPLVACLARISRALTPDERDEMSRFSEFSLGDETVACETVAWSCRPEETEASEKRLSDALGASARRAQRLHAVPDPARAL